MRFTSGGTGYQNDKQSTTFKERKLMELNTEHAMAPAPRKAIAVRHGEQLVAQAAKKKSEDAAAVSTWLPRPGFYPDATPVKAPRTTVALSFRVDHPSGWKPRDVAAHITEYAEKYGLLDFTVTIVGGAA